MIIAFLPLVVLALAAYRITRFLVIDSLIEGLRAKFYVFLSNRQGKLRAIWQKLLELSSCTWCCGAWVSLALYSVYLWTSPLDFGRMDWISVFAIAGIQGLLHAFEPGDE